MLSVWFQTKTASYLQAHSRLYSSGSVGFVGRRSCSYSYNMSSNIMVDVVDQTLVPIDCLPHAVKTQQAIEQELDASKQLQFQLFKDSSSKAFV
ncbi:hypothetical protein V6N11_004344 [Hibiscus sabdariffa]|uniref:Uncharacterized protein n=1 Tax=Hibiscus sabdariffa TaxID=183260 RepID=A0ABR2SGA1_9ROSI